jgi:hypothetical protein
MIIDDFKAAKLAAELEEVNGIQQELADLMFDAAATAMTQCRAQGANPGIYWAMLATTMVGLLASQARGLNVSRALFLRTVEDIYDLSVKVNKTERFDH